MNMVFGEHFMLDGYGGNAKLNDRNAVVSIIDSIVEHCGMRKLMETVVLWAEPNGKHDSGGWSGFVMVQESHISVHTFPDKGFVTMDAYTCKTGLDKDMIEMMVVLAFGLEKATSHLIKRGLDFPA